MLEPTRLACAIALPLLLCGCQSYSTPTIQPVAAQCLPAPAPTAWFMEEHAPNFNWHMLNELFESSMRVTKD